MPVFARRRGRPCRRAAPLRLLCLEDRLAPAVFNIPNGDTAAFVAAVRVCNTNNQPDTINLASGGTYTFTTPVVLAPADAAPPNAYALPPIALDGNNPANSITINGNGSTVQLSTALGAPDLTFVRVGTRLTNTFPFYNPSYQASDFIVTGLTVKDFGIFAHGANVRLTDCVMTRSGVSLMGDRLASLTLERCTVADGIEGQISAVGAFGGARLTVVDSAIHHNPGNGIGFGGSVLTVTNSTVHNNRDSGILFYWIRVLPPLVFPQPEVTITHSTITDNGRSTNGLGLQWEPDITPPRVGHTVIAGNGGDITGPVRSLGYNFIGDGRGATSTGTDRVGTPSAPLDPRLGALQDNGGPTLTRLPLPGSLLTDAGDPAFAAPPAVDQRGRPRVQNGRIDIGAAESPTVLHVASAVVNGGAAQRSRVTELTVAFSGPVSLPALNSAAAFRLTRTGPDGPLGDVTLVADLSGSTAASTVVRLTFFGPLTEFGSLADGDYTLTVLGSQVSRAGQALDGDGDGAPGGDFRLSFHRLFGDAGGRRVGPTVFPDFDRGVDAIDFDAFRRAYGGSAGQYYYQAYFDWDADGDVDALDFFQFRRRFGTRLP